MQDVASSPENYARRISFIRDEMRFEIGVLNDRINALISAEAFLMIAFTMELANSDAHWSARFFLVLAPMLSSIGFLLALLAWPGINTGVKIMIEWNAVLLQTLNDAPGVSSLTWRPSLLHGGGTRTRIDHRNSMLFARTVPAVFAVAWAILTVVVAIAPWR